MGAGIAQVITLAGLPVVIKDIDPDMLDKAMDTIHGIYQRRVDRDKLTPEQMQEKLGLVTASLNYDELSDVDIVFEAVPENMRIKRAVLRELDEACPPEAIFASNTSALSISGMASVTKRPHKVIGMHFFNPAHVMKLVEVTPGDQTDEDTVETAVQFAQELRKMPVRVKEGPGFLVNRLLLPYLNEAVKCLEEGAASTAEVDEAMRAFGWPMGPFRLMDMLGIDVCHDVATYLHSSFGDRMTPPHLFARLVGAGRYGEKTGAGFYGYGDQSADPVREMIAELQASGAVQTGTEFSADRLMMLLVNEAARCVEDEIASVTDIDVACIAGLGMKVGDTQTGPLQYGDELGLDTVAERLETLRTRYGDRFKPVELLCQKVETGDLGKKTGRGFIEWTV